MAPPDAESPPPANSEGAIRELIRGREVATRLGALLRRGSSGEGGLDEAGELAEEVLTSLSKALLALDSGETSEVCQGAPAVGASSLCSNDGRSVASAGKRKARPGGYRRGGQRRRSHAYARTLASKSLDDGHTWRKYGQKGIQSAKFPRSYFRCTHKHDQGCQAIRQVQKSEDDPSTFLITYMGHHTCMNAAKSAQPCSRRDAAESFLISFEAPGPQLDNGGVSPPAPAAMVDPPPKRECLDDDVLSNLSRNDSSSEYLMLPELAALDTSVLLPGPSGAASDIGDVTSGLLSSCVSPSSLDMDFAGESFEFEDVFNWNMTSSTSTSMDLDES